MKILIDQDIPYLEALFANVGEVIKRSGRDIVADDLRDVVALIVRSVTTVDDSLLKEANYLKFVASVTSGDDHLDKSALEAKNIFYYVAKGCNAPAVVNYVLSSLAALQGVNKLNKKPVIAIVGVGCVGGLLDSILKTLGFSTVCYDPPRALRDPQFISSTWDAVLQADLICLHTSLQKTGPYPSYHLINSDIMTKLPQGTVILNAARGAVVDNQAIKCLGQHLTWCLDVWENEPAIDLEVLKQAFIATPHIAGYSQESHRRAAVMVYQVFCQHFAIHQDPCSIQDKPSTSINTCVAWRDAAVARLNVLDETIKTKTKLILQDGRFDSLRLDYQRISRGV